MSHQQRFFVWICSIITVIVFGFLIHKSHTFPLISASSFFYRASSYDHKFKSAAAVSDSPNKLSQILLPNTLEINKAIIGLFGQKERPSLRDVQSLLSANLPRMTAINAVTLMHRCSKINRDVRTFLDESTILNFLDPSLHTLDSMGICNCLYSLQNYDDRYEFTTKVTIRVIEQIERLPLGCKVTALGISNSLYGMKSFSWQGSNSIKLLQTLRLWIIRSHMRNNNDNNNNAFPAVQFTPQTLSNCFLGLQSLPCSFPIKTWFMQFLLQSLDHVNGPVDAFCVANILLGLKVTDTRYTPAINILQKIVEKCQNQPEILYNLDGKKLSMSMWGLQGMVGEQTEITDLLTIFNHRIEEIMLSRNRTRIEALKFQSTEEVGLLLSGMRGLSSDSSAVRRFVFNCRRLMQMPKATSPKLKRKLRKKGKYWILVNRQEKFLASALHGLQRFDDSHEEVRGLLRELIQALDMDLHFSSTTVSTITDEKRKEDVVWSFRSISSALFGLQSMSSSNSSEAAQVVKILSYLFPQHNDDIDSDHYHLDYRYHYRGSAQEIGMAFYGLKSMSITHIPDLPRVLKALTTKVKAFQTKDEFGLREVAMSVYGLRNMDIGHPAVRYALESLIDIIKLHNQHNENAGNSIRTIDKGSLLMILLGIENMGIFRSSTVRKFIKHLTPLIESCPDSFLPSELAVMLRSLSNMGCDNDVNKMRLLQQQLITNNGGVFLEGLEGLSMIWNNTATTKNRKLFIVPLVIQPFLQAVAKKLKQREAPLTVSMVCSALFGLQGFTAEDRSVLSIIKSLSDDLEISQDHLSDQDIGMGLYGLQNMTAASYQVQRLLTAFAAAIDRSTETNMSMQSISTSFFGLQSMSSTSKEVKLILDSLANKVETVCNDPFFATDPSYEMTNSQLGKMFFGLRHKYLNEGDDDHESYVLRRVLQLMTKLTRRSRAELTAHSLANAFSGLQGFNSNFEEVRQALASLAHKLVLSSYPFTGMDYGIILYALRKMDPELPEMRVIYGTLLYRMKKSPSTLQLQEMSMMIMGILRTTEWIREDFLKIMSAANVATTALPPSNLPSTEQVDENSVDAYM